MTEEGGNNNNNKTNKSSRGTRMQCYITSTVHQEEQASANIKPFLKINFKKSSSTNHNEKKSETEKETQNTKRENNAPQVHTKHTQIIQNNTQRTGRKRKKDEFCFY